MYEIMIIDDDANVRERLKSIIDWDKHSAHLACEAEDSETARELYMLYQPKIIITDIKIPIISGLDLAADLQKEDPELQFIVITGYNDFDLVRQTLDLRAVSLLGKPVRSEDINNSIAKAIQQLVAMREKNASTAALRQIINNNLPQLQEAFRFTAPNTLLYWSLSEQPHLIMKTKKLFFCCCGISFKTILPDPTAHSLRL